MLVYFANKSSKAFAESYYTSLFSAIFYNNFEQLSDTGKLK
jgi:hypothetical protein